MLQNLVARKLETFEISDVAFGCVPKTELLEVLSSGRLLGVLLEADISNRFANLSRDGCTQGNGPDVLVTIGSEQKTVQCKCFNFDEKDKNKTTNGCWITKSSLWDTARGCGKKQIAVEDWDSTHDNYFSDYDYFLVFNIAKFPVIELVLFETSFLVNRPEIADQAAIRQYGRKGPNSAIAARHKEHQIPFPKWKFPTHFSHSMWVELTSENKF